MQKEFYFSSNKDEFCAEPHALGRVLGLLGNRIIVARDVFEQSMQTEKLLLQGLLCTSAQIWVTGVLPTPALCFVAQSQGADFAVMILSHPRPTFKIFGKDGAVLTAAKRSQIQNMLDSPLPQTVSTTDVACDTLTQDEQQCELAISLHPKNHRIRIADGAEFLYCRHTKSMFFKLDNTRLHIDTAGGCLATIAPKLFQELGASVRCENNVRGEMCKCGFDNIQAFAQSTLPSEIGFAFNRDGDRVLAVVHGRVYDGDAMLLALSTLYRIQGKLRKKYVVGTYLSNSRLQRELAYQNTALMRTDGSQVQICEVLQAENCLLGGTPDGLILMMDKAPVSDALVTALSLLEVKRTIGSLPTFSPYPTLRLDLDCSNADLLPKLQSIRTAHQKSGRCLWDIDETTHKVHFFFECLCGDSNALFDKIRCALA